MLKWILKERETVNIIRKRKKCYKTILNIFTVIYLYHVHRSGLCYNVITWETRFQSFYITIFSKRKEKKYSRINFAEMLAQFWDS